MKNKSNPTVFLIVIYFFQLLFDRIHINKLKEILNHRYVNLINCMPKFYNEYLEKKI